MTPDQLADLHALCFTTPRPWKAAEFADLLDMRGVFLITQGRGMIMGRVIADEVELLTLAVHPDERRSGAGRALVEAFVTRATEMGASTAFLEVAAPNTAAIALYEVTGFETTGTRPGYYRTPDGQTQNARIMCRDLGRR